VAVIVDTGVLFALADQRDFRHQTVQKYLAANPDTLIVPGPVVWETCAALLEYLGPDAELGFLQSLANRELLVEEPSGADLTRVIEILHQYRDARFGVVDAMIMAIAERLQIQTILTLDRRDFSIYRPKHCSAFRLVPERL
jgi:predicted nucleic acid-binding protein